MKNEMLKPCPFCGGRAKVLQSHNPYVICEQCHVSTPMFSWKQDAIAAWNRRIEEPEVKPGDSHVRDCPVNARWIPVTERMPETDEIMAVRCVTKKGVVSWNRAWYDAKNDVWHGSGTFACVTHWMPISTEVEE